MNDVITIDHLEVRTHIGVPEEERREAQTIHICLELFGDTRPTARSDDVDRSIDYAAVVTTVRQLAAIERHTIERFAEDIADAVLAKFSPESVRVWVGKYPADLQGVRASVTITRP